MLTPTQGIVLKTINYSETSVIAKIYTRELGLRAYMVNGVRSVKGRQKAAMLQMLNHLELVVYEREDKPIQRIKEMKYATINTSIPFEVVKTSVALFFCELLFATLKEESGNSFFFDYIIEEINSLENASAKEVANMPIHFMLSLTEFLGFFPSNNYSKMNNKFDLKEGQFVNEFPIKNRIIGDEESLIFSKLIDANYESWHEVLYSRNQRRNILNVLQLYYSWHIENFSHLRSLKVLETIF